MSLKSRLDRAFGLGPSDDPRAIAVSARRARVEAPLVSTPGARLRMVRSGARGDLARLLLWCHRAGVPVEWSAGEAESIQLDGVEISAKEARARLSPR